MYMRVLFTLTFFPTIKCGHISDREICSHGPKTDNIKKRAGSASGDRVGLRNWNWTDSEIEAFSKILVDGVFIFLHS